MDFKIGQIFEGAYPPEAAVWCNENNAYIEEIDALDGKRRFQIKAVPELSIDELKTAKSEQVKSAYLKYRADEATVPSILGFTADANTRAWTDVMGLATKAQSAAAGEKITFRAADNTFHEITRDQLGTLLLEIIAAGEDSYAQKWAMDKAIEAAATKDELDAIDTTFKSPAAPIAVDTLDQVALMSNLKAAGTKGTGSITVDNGVASVSAVTTIKIPNSEITNEGQGVVQIKPYVTMRNEGTSTGSSIAEDIEYQYPLRTASDPNVTGRASVYIDPMFFNKSGVSCYRYLDEDESITPNKEGAVWFGTQAVLEGGFLQVDKAKKLLGIQETDGKDPNTTDGSDFLMIYRIAMDGVAPSNGTVRIWVQEHNALGEPIDVAEDENGNLCGASRTYSKGDKLGVLQIVRFIKAKGLKNLSFMARNPFDNDLALGNRTNGNSCVVIQEVTDSFRTGPALQQFELDTQQNIPFTRHYLGAEHITLKEIVINDEAAVDIPAGTWSGLDDGWGVYARLPVTFSVQNNTIVAEQTGQNMADFVFFNLLTPQKTALVRGQSEKVSLTIKNEQGGFRLLLLKWTRNTQATTVKMTGRTNNDPSFEDGWVVVENVGINENTVDQTVEHEFTIPTDAVQYAYALIPTTAQNPINMVLSSFVGDIVNPYFSHVVERPVIIENAMRYDDELYEFSQGVGYYYSLRYTVAADYRPCPVGLKTKGGDALTIDPTVQVISGSQAVGGEGALVCAHDGVMQWTTNFLVLNEKEQDNVFNARLVKIKPNGTKETIKDALLSVSIPAKSTGTHAELKTGKFKVNAGDKLGLDFSSNELDGCYLMSKEKASPLVHTIIRYEEIL